MAAVAAPPLLRLTPRPYQHEAVAALLAAAARGVQRPLLVLPTGTGKTIIFALLVQRRGGRALILAHRDELIQQAVDKLHLVDPTMALVVGVTATPARGDRQSLRQVLLQADFDVLCTQHGDFVEAELETLLLEANAPAQVLAAFQAHAADRKALLFTPTVATAYAMAATFSTAGIAAEALDATTPLATRRALLQRLQTGATRVVANCAVLTEGFDEPSLDCIIVARPTQSLPLYQQMLGRGTRTYPGKPVCPLPDAVGVTPRHTLHTVATLFGCAPAALARQSVLEVLAARERQARQPAEVVAGTLRSTPVDLFARRTLRWVQTRQGAWVLSLGAQQGTVRLRPDGPETWQVVQVRRATDPLRLGDTLPLPYAQGLAEDYARHLGVARLVEAEAPWRQQPATEKQTALLRKLGMTARAGLTKGEAADLLAAVLGDWD